MPYSDPEKQKEYQEKYAKTSKRKSKIKEYKERNLDKIKKSNKEYKDKNKKDILEKQAAWYQENRERILAENKIKQKKPEKRYVTTRNQATRRKIEMLLTLEEYKSIISKPCFYCNYLLGSPVEKGCGIDRLNNNIGYTVDNSVSCCRICNQIKMDNLTPEETKAAVEAILKIRGII